jgi:hypothetical protein
MNRTDELACLLGSLTRAEIHPPHSTNELLAVEAQLKCLANQVRRAITVARHLSDERENEL